MRNDDKKSIHNISDWNFLIIWSNSGCVWSDSEYYCDRITQRTLINHAHQIKKGKRYQHNGRVVELLSFNVKTKKLYISKIIPNMQNEYMKTAKNIILG
jgi:hypothetical protein